MKAVIFDHNALRVSTTKPDSVTRVSGLLEALKALGLKIVIFSTHPIDIETPFRQRGYPPADLYLTKEDVGKNKGSPEWIYVAARRLNIQPHDFLYVGTDEWDWRTAINAATLYLHVGSLPAGVTAIIAQQPADVLMYATHFLLNPPRWEYVLDDEARKIHLRCLLGAGVALPCTQPGSQFTLQGVFTYKFQVTVGNMPAGDLLMLHALTSLYREGLIARNSPFAVYPGSTPGQPNPVLEEFVKPASRLFHGYFRDDLLVRAVQAPDTSMARVKAKKTGQTADIDFTTQANTVHLNPKYRDLIRERTIIVFDDFTTTGMSLEWARNLLYAAGAARIILITIGKYKQTHTAYLPTHDGIVDAFGLKKYTLAMFKPVSMSMAHDLTAQQRTRRSFELWREGKPYPLGS